MNFAAAIGSLLRSGYALLTQRPMAANDEINRKRFGGDILQRVISL
jgi:hypothetical protein